MRVCWGLKVYCSQFQESPKAFQDAGQDEFVPVFEYSFKGYTSICNTRSMRSDNWRDIAPGQRQDGNDAEFTFG